MYPVWQVLIPDKTNKGKKFEPEHRAKFDTYVLKAAGRYTIMPEVEGADADGKETMIPYVISCREDVAVTIVKTAQQHYNQKNIMWWKLSDEARFMGGPTLDEQNGENTAAVPAPSGGHKVRAGKPKGLRLVRSGDRKDTHPIRSVLTKAR